MIEMRTGTSSVLLSGLLLSGLFASAHGQSITSKATTKPQPKLTKKVTVSIEDLGGGGASATTSFPVKLQSKPTVTIYWNGYGFLCKTDSGDTFWQCSNDLAFGKHWSAQFIIKSKVTVTDGNGIPTTSNSRRKVTVKRGVPVTL